MSGEREVKQVIVIRSDLRMRRGKEIAQGAHAAMAFLTGRLAFGGRGDDGAVLFLPDAAVAVFTEAQHAWLAGALAKVTCRVRSEDELLALKELADAAGVEAHLIQDAGRTEFHGVPTWTALAVGPDWADRVDKVTQTLELY